jgi:alkaline phosphatase
MKSIRYCILPLLLLSSSVFSQEKVRNLIVMIPDGTSSSILSIARWYKFGACPADNCRLAIDRHICGMVSTYNSDSPIGDSAPTGSTYATGYLSNTGFVATYPVSSGKKDLVRVDPLRSYHPLFTILEAARLQGKSTGLVVTCEFPHATPADFSAHTPDRDDEEGIAFQMVHNHLNVVFGGGMQYLDPGQREDDADLFNVLRTRNYDIVTSREQFDALTPDDSLVYGLFAENHLPYHIDRDPDSVPSLAEMTRKAIRILSEDPNGFFLMVEGSKIDWAAHANDPVGIITEYLAFDEALKEVMDFANRDGYTAVVVVPDHGNSGISLGNRETGRNYDQMDVNELIRPLRKCNMTADGITSLIKASPDQAAKIFFDHTGLRLTEEETGEIKTSLESDDKYDLPVTVANLITRNTFIGFTTHGHTGEDVMLAVYHPGNYRPTGIIKNSELHDYMAEIFNTPDLDSLSDQKFCIDTVALAGLIRTIDTTGTKNPRLIIRDNPKSKTFAVIESGTDYLTVYSKEKPVNTISFNTLALYVKPLHHFFVPKDMGTLLPEEITGTK